MRKLEMFTLVVFSILIFNSCLANKISQPIDGNYSSVKNGYTIKLNADSTFTYSIGFSGSLISRCSGNWKLSSKKKSIKLVCQKEDELEELTSTYMKKRVHLFKVKNNRLIQDKLKLSKK